ncbi:adenylyltransferase and sulfurtransferase MOCS3 isoform X2 [Bicyclus anynana]|uniref:Adenylyltransferase and sulfurtransferase MOCS3 homolog n=1 Tax=Bicyclus anynana TaxID=110368 RepID=A0A6J1MZY5_BICAN|nr:adenylyltransferase and sulfurtransferase MOCS3 isoform X2 [Bicyclus anynana]
MDVIQRLEQEIAELKDTLQMKEQELVEIKQKFLQINENSTENTKVRIGGLPKWAIERYSRQILLPDIGVQGQGRLMAARVLIVGAGGLGCPASAYLAGAGVGEIGIIDYDEVDVTNIHRQILHRERDQNLSKAQSAANSLRSINSKIKITPYSIDINPSNGLEIAKNYDLILDCTDNVPTRYMLNDISVLTGIPLISGSALKMEGQLTIYGYRGKGGDEKQTHIGPCYRCIFPRPPPPETVGSCSAQGVAGPIPGVIGVLQALEAIKLLVGHPHTQLLVQRMLLFDGGDSTFRTVKLRPRSPACEICSDEPTITKLLDYEVVCQSQAKEKDLDLHILQSENRISAKELAKSLNAKERHLLVDVRSEAEFNMCNIDGAVNYPLEKLREKQFEELMEKIRSCTSYVTFVCRRGNDSQLAAERVLDALVGPDRSRVRDLTGGLHAWARHVDIDFPVY